MKDKLIRIIKDRYMISVVFNSFARKLCEKVIFKNRRIYNINYINFRKEIIPHKDYKPIFFLSTGRTGTAFFTKLLSKSKKVKVFHSPTNLLCFSSSELIEQSKTAYEFYKKYGLDNKEINIMLSQIFLAARENLIYLTYLHGKNYIETNNRITFFAPAIKYLIPNSKFVHLYRHPGEFVRSGIRRKYYNSLTNHELGRLIPVSTELAGQWNKFDTLQKIAWLWKETNLFIEEFFESLASSSKFKMNINNLNFEEVKKLLQFLEIDDIRDSYIEKMLEKKVNIQIVGNFPEYKNWTKSDKEKLKEICGDLAEKYGYEL